jgi:hypothetical protein
MWLSSTYSDAENSYESMKAVMPTNARAWIPLSDSAALVTLMPLEPLRRVDSGIRRLGYPAFPLTGASRDDVQAYLDDVEVAVNQIPIFARTHAAHKWKYGQLTDYYLGTSHCHICIIVFTRWRKLCRLSVKFEYC